ncbi:MAG: leucyl aminopeptidase family protein [Proteobacteria bacterium]|nr:leucyl aminopeptidase family protein [Pseudomonadota bacterium]MDA1311615.1 leucyl aminopeptidase family protein [Pseudomonadota bacterium]
MTFAARKTSSSVPIFLVTESGLKDWGNTADTNASQWVAATGFTAAAGAHCCLPNPNGGLAGILVGVTESETPSAGLWDLAGLPTNLPEGRYYLDTELGPEKATMAALGWALGCYSFDRYKKTPKPKAELVLPTEADRAEVNRIATGIGLTRDLITTPAGDMGPEDLAEAAKAMAKPFKAKVKVIVGKDLLRKNYPSIHAVGRAAAQEPRLIDITWGKTSNPRVTLVGKGVCFDTGGLDIKSAGGMLNMKKDMGGAAQVLGLAHMIMDAGLPVRLRVLAPAVENAISSNAFHPLDVLRTRKGLTVEVGNTDAEGRLILSDALSEAASDKPEMIIDFATLTGAARVALGTDVPALFCNDDALAEALLAHGTQANDPLWRMPLWQGYKAHLSSKVADLSSTGSAPQGGAIKAALFLEHFVEPDIPWAHIDLMAFNSTSRPGRPEGGEAQGIRGIYAMLKKRYA